MKIVICFGISELMNNPQYSLELGSSEQDEVQVAGHGAR